MKNTAKYVPKVVIKDNISYLDFSSFFEDKVKAIFSIETNLNFRNIPENWKLKRSFFYASKEFKKTVFFSPRPEHKNSIISIDNTNRCDYDPVLVEENVLIHFTNDYSDGLITNNPNQPLVIMPADCIVVYMYDTIKETIALIHAGWNGVLLDVISKGVETMVSKYGASEENIKLVFSPHILQKHFEVKNDVLNLFKVYIKKYNLIEEDYILIKNNKSFVDLTNLSLDVLFLNHGKLKLKNIYVSNECTFSSTNPDSTPLFHSHRRDGVESGRNLALFFK